MARRILALVKKDFRFNKKMTLIVLAFMLGWSVLLWSEYQFNHQWEEDIAYLIYCLVAFMGVMPINISFDREKSPSTKRFLSSLPVSTSELFIANMVTKIIYLSVLAATMTFCVWVFDMPYGFQLAIIAIPAGMLVSAAFTLLYYLFTYMTALICLLVSMELIMIIGMKSHIETMAFFTDPGITIPVCIAMASLAILIIAVLCKIKRRLL